MALMNPVDMQTKTKKKNMDDDARAFRARPLTFPMVAQTMSASQNLLFQDVHKMFFLGNKNNRRIRLMTTRRTETARTETATTTTTTQEPQEQEQQRLSYHHQGTNRRYRP